MTTLAGFLLHAKLFGPECVAETAHLYLREEDLVLLRVELDARERNKKSSHGYSVGVRRRRRKGETEAAVRQLRAAGLVPSAIADKLGIKDETVRRLLSPSRSETAETSSEAVQYQNSRSVEPGMTPVSGPAASPSTRVVSAVGR